MRGGVEVTLQTAVRKVPDSIPGSSNIFMFVFFCVFLLLLVCLNFVVPNTLFVMGFFSNPIAMFIRLVYLTTAKIVTYIKGIKIQT